MSPMDIRELSEARKYIRQLETVNKELGKRLKAVDDLTKAEEKATPSVQRVCRSIRKILMTGVPEEDDTVATEPDDGHEGIVDA